MWVSKQRWHDSIGFSKRKLCGGPDNLNLIILRFISHCEFDEDNVDHMHVICWLCPSTILYEMSMYESYVIKTISLFEYRAISIWNSSPKPALFSLFYSTKSDDILLSKVCGDIFLIEITMLLKVEGILFNKMAFASLSPTCAPTWILNAL